jgi:hypothetical protein
MYRGCVKCNRIEESYHPSMSAVLHVEWRQIGPKVLHEAFDFYRKHYTKEIL